MIDNPSNAVFYCRLEEAVEAAENAWDLFKAGEGEMPGLVYVAVEPPPERTPNLIHAPMDGLAELFLQTTLPLPEGFFSANPDGERGVDSGEEAAFFSKIAEIEQVRQQHLSGAKGSLLAVDTLFLEKHIALAIAYQGNRVDLGHPTIDGLQVCYYEGAPFEDAPENLVNIESGDLVAFFTETRLRLPRHLVIAPGVPEVEVKKLQDAFGQLGKMVREARDELAFKYLEICKKESPRSFNPDEPLRVFLPADRCTEVMQYASRGLAEAFRALGHDAWLSMEQSDMEELDYQRPQEQAQCNPDLIVNINHLNNQWLHPDLFNLVWWQDPMPELTRDGLLPWRSRDLVYAIIDHYGELAIERGAKNYELQVIGIDEKVFRPDPDVEREDKVVFVGSSYRSHLPDHPMIGAVVERLKQVLASNRIITLELCKQIAEEMGVAVDIVWNHTTGYVVRDTLVRWLCSNPTHKVEVYGRGWDADPVVAPFYRGEVAHGPELARIYNSARYGFSIMHNMSIGHQRFGEICACGATPIVYDCREVAPEPHWDDHCLFFRNEQELHGILGKQPSKGPEEIAASYSYQCFAQRIIEAIKVHFSIEGVGD